MHLKCHTCEQGDTKRAWQGATGFRQMEHSELPVEAASESLDLVFFFGALEWLTILLYAAVLKLFRLFCQPRFISIRIFTQRKITSSPPLKSMPSCTKSPSLTGNGRDSMPGPERRTWLRKVPELDFTSFTYHCPLDCQNSQCLRETTFDLKPTGATAEGVSFHCEELLV